MRKIISLIILASFLSANTAYSSNLRVPVGQIESKREAEALLREKLKNRQFVLSLIKEVIDKRFSSTPIKKKEAWEIILDSENAISGICELSHSIDELREACDSIVTFIDFGIKLKDKQEPKERWYILDRLEMIVEDVVENTQELKLFCNHVVPEIINQLSLHRDKKREKTAGVFHLGRRRFLDDMSIDETGKVFSLIPSYDFEEILDYVKNYGGFYFSSSIINLTKYHIGDYKIRPLVDFSRLEATQILFLDTKIIANPGGFEKALKEVRVNEHIPVILLTDEIEDTVEVKLGNIDLKGVQFRTPAELGLQNLNWDEDERVIEIAGIDNLKCIPLTDALCDTYDSLKKARDQV